MEKWWIKHKLKKYDVEKAWWYGPFPEYDASSAVFWEQTPRRMKPEILFIYLYICQRNFCAIAQQ